MDYFIKVLLFQTFLGCIPLLQAVETRNVTYCEMFTHIFVNASDPNGNVIVTRTAEDEDTYYSENLYCAWGLHADRGKRTHVTVVQYDLDDAPQGADCYDHTYVAIKQDDIQDSYNWLEADPGMYFRMCGSLAPPEFSSEDSEVIIEFSSEANPDHHKGVEFKVTEFAVGTCPPGWTDMNDICYKLFTNPETWPVSQEFCTLIQANLASIESEEEADVIHDMIASSENITADDWVWLGQYYPKQEEMAHWIDETDMNFNLSSKWPEVDPDMTSQQNMYRCSAVAANGRKTYQQCQDSDNRHAYICKSQKDGSTQLYATDFETDGDDVETSTVVSASQMLRISGKMLIFSTVYLLVCH